MSFPADVKAWFSTTGGSVVARPARVFAVQVSRKSGGDTNAKVNLFNDTDAADATKKIFEFECGVGSSDEPFMFNLPGGTAIYFDTALFVEFPEASANEPQSVVVIYQ